MLQIKRVRKFFKTEFAIALTTTSFTTAIQMLAGVVINKILAITVGPSGIAMMGQFNNFKDLATNLANGSFGQGVTKYIADSTIDNTKVISTSNLFTLVLSSIIGSLTIIFANNLSVLLFNDPEYKFVFIVFGFTLPFFAINNLLISTVNGYRDFKTLAKLKITNSVIALAMSGSLAWLYLLKGALLSQAVNTSIVFFASFLLIYKFRFRYLSFNWALFDKKILKKLLAFTLMALTSAQLKPIVQLIIRDYIITHAGNIDAGIWEATKKLSDYYNKVIIVALGAYYLPKLSSLKNPLTLKKEILYGIKIIMPLFLLLATIIFLLKGWIIPILFSSEFLSMKDLIFPQLIGDFFMILSFMFGYLLLAKSMVKIFMILQISLAMVRISLSFFLFQLTGLIGLIWANAFIYLINLIVLMIIFRKILFAQEKKTT